MEEKKSLNNKYQKIDIDETPVEVEEPKKEKPKKEKKVKEPKVKKEKAPKEPKKPEEKKEKAPKEPKPPKEKKVKEPKPPKEKKIKEPKPPKPPKVKKEKKNKVKTEVVENQSVEISEEIAIDNVQTVVSDNGRRSEEIVLPAIKSVKQVSGEKPKKEKKAKKEKAPKQPKEKKVKEPKQPKEKKVKEPKSPKVKKEKLPKEPKQPKEKKPREPLNKKDFATIGVAVFALLLVVVFAVVKYVPESQIGTDFTETTTVAQDKLASIQIVRDGVAVNLVQTDIPDVFYGYSSDYKLQYYQYKGDKMVPVKSTGTVNASIDMGNETIPVKIDYVELGGKIFGTGLFVANKSENVYFYDMLAFQLVNLPKGYSEEGKALLLATTSKNVLTQKVTLWPESFVVDLETGKTSRFLKVINRNIDVNTGAGVEDFCMLTNDGYNASNKIPFITAREYEAGSGQYDIFVKLGKDEKLYVNDIYGKFLLTDGDSVIFMRKTDKGFDVIRKTGEEETVTGSFYGTMGTNYMYSGDYIFNKNDGKLYNLKTGETKTIIGYRMSAEMINVSPDGKYLVMLGTVTNMMDYQVHIFNLQTGEYTKFKDDNYSSHSNLTFINNTTAVYMVLDPNQGYEYVALDMNKVK
ncbi:MAG: hypothetical protein IKU41_00705 [Clostridia bacterium]|nr:hypothetical protein [Clostridia bacterium]